MVQDLGFYYVWLTCVANIHGLFLWKIKKVIQKKTKKKKYKQFLKKSNRKPN